MTNEDRAEVLIEALHGAPRDKAIALIAAYTVEIWQHSHEYIEELENALQKIHDKWANFSWGCSEYNQGYSDALAACSDIGDAVLVKRGMLNYGRSV